MGLAPHPSQHYPPPPPRRPPRPWNREVPHSDAERRRSRCHSSVLNAAHLVLALPWSLMPVPPLGVPKRLSLGFWAGFWGLVYPVLEPPLTARAGSSSASPPDRVLVRRTAAEGFRRSAAASTSRWCRSMSPFRRFSALARR